MDDDRKYRQRGYMDSNGGARDRQLPDRPRPPTVPGRRLTSPARASPGIPFNHGNPGIRFEASMGMLPGHILRTT